MSEYTPKVEMLRSVKGKDMLLIDEFLYHYDDRTSKAYRWVCSRRKDKVPCRVRLYTSLIDEWDLTRHKVENLVGAHPHGPAEPDAIIRAREKKKQADTEGSPCTLSNKSLKRRMQRQDEVKKIKLEVNTDGASNDEAAETRDSSDDEFGDLVESLGIKMPKAEPIKEKKVLMLKTAKGHHMIAVEGCVYRLDGKSMLSTTYRWKCFRSKDLQCTGKIYTECLANGHHRFKPMRLEENNHNHQPYSEIKIEALIRRNNIKILHGKEEQSSLKVFDGLTASPAKKVKVEKKPKSTSVPLSVSKGSGNVLSISTDISVTPRPDVRRQRSEATSKLYRYEEDTLDVLDNPKDGEITKFTFLPSLKGNRILIMDCMIFHYDSRGSVNDRAYWTCLYRRDKTYKCNCRLTTEGLGTNLKIVKVSSAHKHMVDHREHIDRRMKQNLKVKEIPMEPQKLEVVSMDNDLSQYQTEDDDDGHHQGVADDTTFSNENSAEISDFLQIKPFKTKVELPDISQDYIETTIEDINASSIIEYKNEVETDPFQETQPIIEYVEMERINTNQYCSDSASESEYKPRATRTRNKPRKSAANDADDDDDDYIPSPKAGRRTQSLLKKYSQNTPNASYNPDNINIEKTTKLRSAKGGELLCVDGFIYHLKSISPTTRTYWACIKSKDRILKCPARVTTVLNSSKQLTVVHLSNSHTHPVSEDDIKKRLFNEFAKSSANPDLKTKHIMDKPLSELNPEFAYLLGDVKKEKFTFNMKLYAVSDGPPSLAVRMCLKALNIPYELHNVDYIASEHMSEEYAKMNPQKEIPVLDDNGFFLPESIAIMQYLCDKYAGGDTVLYPKDPKERALVNHRLCFNMGFYYSSIGAYSMAPIFFDYERTEMGLKKVNNALAVFETYLKGSGTKYAASKNVTIADFALISATLCLEAISFDLSVYPLITKWYNTFKKEHADLWSIANAGMEEIAEFEHNRPDLSHMNHPFHPTRKNVSYDHMKTN